MVSKVLSKSTFVPIPPTPRSKLSIWRKVTDIVPKNGTNIFVFLGVYPTCLEVKWNFFAVWLFQFCSTILDQITVC